MPAEEEEEERSILISGKCELTPTITQLQRAVHKKEYRAGGKGSRQRMRCMLGRRYLALVRSVDDGNHAKTEEEQLARLLGCVKPRAEAGGASVGLAGKRSAVVSLVGRRSDIAVVDARLALCSADRGG